MFGFGLPELIIFGILAVIFFSRRIDELRPNLERSYREYRRGFRSAIEKPRFTLNDLMASTALIGLGMGWIVVALPSIGDSLEHLNAPVWMFTIGGAFIGAGVLMPLRRARIGAAVGAFVQLALVYSACFAGWPSF
jgi:DNA-binding transcriptional LysR family regulator